MEIIYMKCQILFYVVYYVYKTLSIRIPFQWIITEDIIIKTPVGKISMEHTGKRCSCHFCGNSWESFA